MMSGKMKALIKKPGEPGAVCDLVPIPEIGKHEVLIKVKAASICGTDVHIYHWDEWAKQRVKPPYVFGHEFSGEVAAVGEHVTSVKEGDTVSAETHIVCGRCVPCLTGKKHVCSNTMILGVDTEGCFAEYVKVPAENIWKNPPGMPDDLASIQEPLGNAVHTVLSGITAGAKTAIVGCGPIGLMAVAVAKAAGASQVIAIDKNEYRLDLAVQMGATETISIEKDDPLKIVSALTGGWGADLVCEMSGHPTAIRQSLKMAANGGRVHILSLPEHPVCIDMTNDIVFKGLTVQGITGRKMFETWRQVSELLHTETIQIRPVITHHFSLEEFEKGFDLMREGQCGKVVLIP
ncbi:L-threonine 3-dehydrogenase [Bacillus sonorensis]|nr:MULTISPECIES: L-threonine 3-dehydrogenase [Bacillus]MCZ0073778.1 L-threonine 3-dehydrogenase [Bacillus sonorensis]MCZ0092400.1 L-threonine 3-dehydrogenase [Bacillus sonorensis]MDR4955397.1 L-threonine 3-dehydrogenase [Bacillus sonorensis]MEC0340800.1 L-threonine 3-dehydrogenase [Bacillus sonorensis]MEC0426477.1 L-threonine 3-dehydrogenase [Bacillus sonorensis]